MAASRMEMKKIVFSKWGTELRSKQLMAKSGVSNPEA